MILLFGGFRIFMEDNPEGLQNQNPLGIMELSVLLRPPAHIDYLVRRRLHVCHGAPHGDVGISSLLSEKHPCITGLVVRRLLWHGRPHCARRRHVAGAGVHHIVAPSVGTTWIARYAGPCG